MVEIFHLRDARPTGSYVTTLAGGLERAFVRIGVATGTFCEGKSGVFHVGFGVLDHDVAFHAIKLPVRTRKRIL